MNWRAAMTRLASQRTAAWAGAGPLARILWQFRTELMATAAFSLVANLMMLTPTLYMLQIYDRVMVSRSEVTLLAASAVALLFLGVMAAAEWLRSQLLVRVGVRFDEALHTRVFQALFARALARPSARPADGLQHLLHLRQFLTGPGVLGFLDLPWTPIYIIISWMLHPALGMLSVAFVALFAGMAWWNHRNQAAQARFMREGDKEITGYVQSKLRNIDAVESMGMIKGLRHRWLGMYRSQVVQSETLRVDGVRQQKVHRFIQYTQQSLILAAGAWLVIRGELSMGAMIAANVLMARALQPMQVIASNWRSYFSAREVYVELDQLLGDYPERTGISLSRAPRGRLQLVDLSAKVPGRESPILSGVDLVLQPGELTVVLGASGSGKSTLARCMLGIGPDTSGRVLLDGEPIGAWDRQELGPHLGYLPQDVQLLAGSVAENIARLGPLNPDRVVRAAQAAGIHDLILRLPEGYDTPLDAFAAQLSAGHRQRIGLARALYGDPALVVLDEPNSNLDEAGETALMKAVDHLRESGKTVVAITHRGQLIQAADRLVLLERGRVVQQGSREDVLRHLAAIRNKSTLSTQAPTAQAS